VGGDRVLADDEAGEQSEDLLVLLVLEFRPGLDVGGEIDGGLVPLQ
jgi:hypothetical protein